jgi:hypothetical protein
MADSTFAEKFGGFWQFDAGDAKLMTSQVPVFSPPQISSLEKPWNKRSTLFNVCKWTFIKNSKQGLIGQFSSTAELDCNSEKVDLGVFSEKSKNFEFNILIKISSKNWY